MDFVCVCVCVLVFETFLGGALWHNVYRGYIVFWGTIITLVWPVGVLTEIKKVKGQGQAKISAALLPFAQYPVADHYNGVCVLFLEFETSFNV